MARKTMRQQIADLEDRVNTQHATILKHLATISKKESEIENLEHELNCMKYNADELFREKRVLRDACRTILDMVEEGAVIPCDGRKMVEYMYKKLGGVIA